jgi:dihydrodipicolinate synthase/N-acetylneuraminate lyase
MPALITPFTRSGALDPEAHTGNVAELSANGVTGFLLGGSTGQGPYLEPGERARLTEATRHAAPRGFVMCGLAGESVRTSLAQAEEAASAGADAVLALTPTSLVRGRHRLVEAFFADLADRCPLPVFLYSVPGVTGYELPVDVIARLAPHPNIVGMKDSGGHPVRAGDIVAATPDGFELFAGASAAVALAVAAGARGAITASANYAAALIGQVVGARSVASAAPAQAALTRLVRVVEPHGVPGTMAAAEITGLSAGTPRRPLRAVPSRERSAIAEALSRAGISPA